ncbi:MAG: hypothetical protein ACFFB3_06880 [Candidatus Hodarchaeota archaeon]
MSNISGILPTLIANYPAPIPIPSSPIILRWEVFLLLFSTVVVLESIIMVLLLQPRARILQLALFANFITSCLIIPSFLFNLGWDWDDFPLMLSASVVRKSSQESSFMGSLELGGSLIASFVLMLFLYGLPTIIIEGAIIRYFVEGSSKRIWSTVALGNVVSYLFMTLWSGYIGFQMRDMNSGEASDYAFKHILSRPSEEEFVDLKFLGWIFFAIVLLLCFSVVYYGNNLSRMASDQKTPSYSIKINTMAFNMGLVYFFFFSLMNHLEMFALVLYFMLSFIFLVATLSEWSDACPQQEPQTKAELVD